MRCGKVEIQGNWLNIDRISTNQEGCESKGALLNEITHFQKTGTMVPDAGFSAVSLDINTNGQ